MPCVISVLGFHGEFTSSSKIDLMRREYLSCYIQENYCRFSDKEQYLLYRRLLVINNEVGSQEFKLLAELLGFWDSQGSPIRCWSCGSADLEESYTTIIRFGFGLENKGQINCKECGAVAGEWDYGMLC